LCGIDDPAKFNYLQYNPISTQFVIDSIKILEFLKVSIEYNYSIESTFPYLINKIEKFFFSSFEIVSILKKILNQEFHKKRIENLLKLILFLLKTKNF